MRTVFLCQGFQKLEPEKDTQTDRQTKLKDYQAAFTCNNNNNNNNNNDNNNEISLLQYVA